MKTGKKQFVDNFNDFRNLEGRKNEYDDIVDEIYNSMPDIITEVEKGYFTAFKISDSDLTFRMEIDYNNKLYGYTGHINYLNESLQGLVAELSFAVSAPGMVN